MIKVKLLEIRRIPITKFTFIKFSPDNAIKQFSNFFPFGYFFIIL